VRELEGDALLVLLLVVNGLEVVASDAVERRDVKVATSETVSKQQINHKHGLLMSVSLF